MLSVLIEALPEQAFLRAGPRSGDGYPTDSTRALRTNVRSVNLLLDSSQNVAVAAFPGDVRSEFDLIVIDAPSLAEHADVAAISAVADYVLLVARDGAYTETVDRAMAALAKFGNPLTGVVVTHNDLRMANYA
jgi:Mrp family chromosome partitioning ATPase